jgi:hypothetical protein
VLRCAQTVNERRQTSCGHFEFPRCYLRQD